MDLRVYFKDDWEEVSEYVNDYVSSYNYTMLCIFESDDLELFEKYYKYRAGEDDKLGEFLLKEIIRHYLYKAGDESVSIIPLNHDNNIKDFISVIFKTEGRIPMIKIMKDCSIDWKEFV